MRFIVVVAMYNMAPWVGNTIQSLINQTYKNFRCFIGDDMSTDDSCDVVLRHIQGDPRFTLVRQREKKFSMGNIHSLIEAAQPEMDDVIVLVDGDDFLAHEGVLQRLKDAYEREDCWMTYGSYSNDGRTLDSICHPYPGWIMRYNLFRFFKWRASHLKTFKYALWKKIPPDVFQISQAELNRARLRALLCGQIRTWWYWGKIDLDSLMNPAGKFPRRCSDKNITVPMLELAGMHSHFIDEILYIYNSYERDLDYGSRNPYAANKKRIPAKWHGRLIRDVLRHKPRLRPLKSLS